jgi:hypothetical protein
MHVVVRVDVIGGPAGHPDEQLDLTVDLALHAVQVLRVDEPLAPGVERHVDPEAELRTPAGLLDRRLRVGELHHEARARHDAAVVRVEDPAVDLGRHAEVVGVHDDETILRGRGGADGPRGHRRERAQSGHEKSPPRRGLIHGRGAVLQH